MLEKFLKFLNLNVNEFIRIFDVFIVISTNLINTIVLKLSFSYESGK